MGETRKREQEPNSTSLGKESKSIFQVKLFSGLGGLPLTCELFPKSELAGQIHPNPSSFRDGRTWLGRKSTTLSTLNSARCEIQLHVTSPGLDWCNAQETSRAGYRESARKMRRQAGHHEYLQVADTRSIHGQTAPGRPGPRVHQHAYPTLPLNDANREPVHLYTNVCSSRPSEQSILSAIPPRLNRPTRKTRPVARRHPQNRTAVVTS